MDGVVSGVFLILESGLCNNGKSKAKAGGESSGAKTGTSLTQTSLPTLPASADAGIRRAMSGSQGQWAQGGEEAPRRLARPWGGFTGSGEGGRKAGPRLTHSQRLSFGNTCLLPGNWKRLGRVFQGNSWLCTTDAISSLPVICGNGGL